MDWKTCNLEIRHKYLEKDMFAQKQTSSKKVLFRRAPRLRYQLIFLELYNVYITFIIEETNTNNNVHKIIVHQLSTRSNE